MDVIYIISINICPQLEKVSKDQSLSWGFKRRAKCCFADFSYLSKKEVDKQ
jgi:hypothetical protein